MNPGINPFPARPTWWLLIICLTSFGAVEGQVTDTVIVQEAILTGDFSGLPEQDHPDGPGFGSHVAIDGDWLAVGTPRTKFHGGAFGMDYHGAVFLFKQVEGEWQYMQRILDPAWLDGNAGCSTVALSVPHLVVGCPFADELNNPSQRSGIARWYRLDQDDIWQLDSGYHGGPGGFCGMALAISDVHEDGSVVLAIGCPGHPLVLGAVAIYEYDALLDQWSGPQFISASDGESSDHFGSSLSLWRSTSGPVSQKLAVGAPFKQHGSANLSGSAYLYEGSSWNESDSTTHPFPDLNEEAFFGSDVDINESQLVVGASGGWSSECPDPPRCGTTRRYIFEGSLPINFAEEGPAVNAQGNPPGQQAGLEFGAQVALGPRNWIAISAPSADGFNHNGQLAEETGTVELRRAGDSNHGVSIGDYWMELRPDPLGPESLSGGQFGYGVDFSRSHLAIGSPGAGNLTGRSGEARIYRFQVIDPLFSDRFEQ